MDFNYNIMFTERERNMSIFNDESLTEMAQRRVHMIYISCEAVAKSSDATLQAEARRWKGERSIAYAKGKRKYKYIGREDFHQEFSDHIINPKTGTFRGINQIPCEGEPLVQYKLWPIIGFDRTLFA